TKGSFILMIALTGASADCSSEYDDIVVDANNDDSDKIYIGQISWPDNIAATNMWTAIIQKDGYDVNSEIVEKRQQMSSLAEDDLDIAPEVWLQVQDKMYYEEYKEEVDYFDEPWYENGKVGLAVPEYMDDINSIEDLNENKD